MKPKSCNKDYCPANNFEEAHICEHMGILAYTGNEISHPSSLSSILAHKRETGHPISFDDFSVLASGRSELDTLIRESLLIAKINPSLNLNIRLFLLMLF